MLTTFSPSSRFKYTKNYHISRFFLAKKSTLHAVSVLPLIRCLFHNTHKILRLFATGLTAWFFFSLVPFRKRKVVMSLFLLCSLWFGGYTTKNGFVCVHLSTRFLTLSRENGRRRKESLFVTRLFCVYFFLLYMCCCCRDLVIWMR